MVLSTLCGLSSALVARSQVSASGPCADMQLCRLAPPGRKPSALASYTPVRRPMNSHMTLRWYQGGRNVSSPTSQRGGKITKSMLAVPGKYDGAVSKLNIEGSGWSKLMVPITMKRERSYLYGVKLPCQATTESGECAMSAAHRLPWNLARRTQ